MALNEAQTAPSDQMCHYLTTWVKNSLCYVLFIVFWCVVVVFILLYHKNDIRANMCQIVSEKP